MLQIVLVRERTLNIRAEEHIKSASNIKSASKRSHTAEYCWKYSHDFDWERKKVLDFEKTGKQEQSIRQYIHKEASITSISFKLPNIWKPILRESKAKKTTAKTTTSLN